MRIRLKIRRGFCLLAAGLCLLGTALAGEAELKEKRLELGGSYLSYQTVAGMEEETLQQQVNSRIAEDLRIQEFVARMNALISDEKYHLTAKGSALLEGEVYSAVLEAEGAVQSLRGTHLWAWSNIDLRDGHEITLGELFPEAEAAREALEDYLEEYVAEELSAHLENSELTPLPEGFWLEKTGLTLLYPAEQLSTLSSRAGAVKIGWNEIREWTDWSEDGIPARIGAADMVTMTESSTAKIREMTEIGQLPDIPVKLGDSVQELTDACHLLNDPDEYAGGRMFSPEGAAFRNVFILSDAVSAKWDQSRVQGIRMDRGCAWGLCIGETEQDTWHRLLGEPDHTVAFDEDSAEAYRTVPGTCDYYEFGDHTLQLYSDESGLLISITLAE